MSSFSYQHSLLPPGIRGIYCE